MRKTLALLLVLLLGLGGAGKAMGEKAASLRDFAAALEDHTARLEDSFTIPCDASVLKALKQPSPIGKDNTLLAEIVGGQAAAAQ